MAAAHPALRDAQLIVHDFERGAATGAMCDVTHDVRIVGRQELPAVWQPGAERVSASFATGAHAALWCEIDGQAPGVKRLAQTAFCF